MTDRWDTMVSEARAHLHTVLDWVRWGATAMQGEVFCGHGTEGVWDESCGLVAALLRLDPEQLQQCPLARVLPSEQAAILHALQQRIRQRKPLPYILGTAQWGGLSFAVDERVLIPRSPLAEWIHKRFEPWLETAPKRILDVGTGSACIPIVLAHVFPEALIHAVDVDPGALEVAAVNVQTYDLGDRIQLFQSDVWDGLPRGTRYDLIISNPPYVPDHEQHTWPPEFDHEPQLALLGGADGLSVVSRVLQQASHWLAPQGWLVIEVGQSADRLAKAYPHVPFLWLDCEQGGDGVLMCPASAL